MSKSEIKFCEIKLFQPRKEFKNYFEIIAATMNMWENIRELQ